MRALQKTAMAISILMLACTALLATPDRVYAQQKFPVKPIRIVVGVTPGVPLAADVMPEWGRIGTQALLAPAGTPLAIRRQIAAFAKIIKEIGLKPNN